jgi:phage I-like protein
MNMIAVEQAERGFDRAPREKLAQELAEVAQRLRDEEPTLNATIDTVSAVLDRLRGLELTESVLASVKELEDPQATVLSRPIEKPLAEWLLVPFGQVDVEQPVRGHGFVFTREHAEAAVRWFAQLGRKLAIDYEHQSFAQLNSRPDGLRPAAGWVGGLEVRDDGLWAVDVQWTERAKTLLLGGEYRYFSPVIFWNDEEYSTLVGLGPIALTNDPAMHNVPSLAAARGLESECSAPDAENSAPAEDGANAEGAGDLEDVYAEVVALRRQLTLQEADTFVERGMRQGKILEATSMDWRGDYLRDPQAAEAKLARSPVILPPGRVVERSPRGEAEEQAGLEIAGHADVCRRAGIEADDLVAYEQAFQAGRVRRFGGSV